MLLDVLGMAAGLLLLLAGGEMLVRGASFLARDLGVPPLAVGLTIVAFGTSAPELAVNVTAAWRGDAQISFGNVVGSNIANIGLILGLSALVHSLEVEGTVISREIPMMLLATLAAMVLGLDRLRGATEGYDLSDGLLLLLLFGLFLYYTVAEVLRGRRRDPLVEQVQENAADARFGSLLGNAVVAGLGLVTLVGGAEVTVRFAVSAALDFGVPEFIIGLTVVAVGTSLPELVTSLVAVRRGQVDLAVGNAVGSNIFNLLFILGVTATIRPVPVPPGGATDLCVLAVLSAGLLSVSIGRRQQISRIEGLLLIIAYFSYMGWRVAAS